MRELGGRGASLKILTTHDELGARELRSRGAGERRPPRAIVFISADARSSKVSKINNGGYHLRNDILDAMGVKQILTEVLASNPIELFVPTN
jgi:hypothetical protein